MRRRITPFDSSPIRTVLFDANVHELVQLELSDRPTYMPAEGSEYPQVGSYDIYSALGRRAHAEKLGEAALVRTRSREQYLTRLAIDAGRGERSTNWGIATLALAAQSAHEDGDVFRTDPAGEYAEVLVMWDRLLAAGIASVVGDEHFPHHEPSRLGREPVQAYRGGHYQITPRETQG